MRKELVGAGFPAGRAGKARSGEAVGDRGGDCRDRERFEIVRVRTHRTRHNWPASRHTAEALPVLAASYFGKRARTAWLGRAMTWPAISLPRPCTLAVPASMAALTAATSPRTMTVI